MQEIVKIQPQSIEMEEAVLGAILLEKNAIFEVMDILTPESFYKEQNGIVYKAICELHKKTNPIDILTVTQEVHKMGKLELVGGAYYISKLTDRIASHANIEYHARIIQQKYMQREMIRIGIEAVKDAYEDTADVFDLMEKSAKQIEVLGGTVKSNKIESIGDIKTEIINDCLDALHQELMSGIPTGISALDKQTNGWQESTLIILAGRPGMGKTAAALKFAIESAKAGYPTAFYSLEMTKKQLVSRALSSETDISSQKIINKQTTPMDIDQMNFGGKSLNEIPLFIDDTPEISINELKNKARRLKREKKIKLLVIDYLQLMKGSDKKGNREAEISEISRGLKVLSRELEIPIIALSQLSRQVEQRGGEKKPQLSDLRESGAIEQDADMVIFTYRPEYYGLEHYTIGKNTYESRNLFVFIIEKFRNGGLGEIKARWIGYLTKICDYVTEQVDNNENPIF